MTTNLESLTTSLQQAGWPHDVVAAMVLPLLMQQLSDELQGLPDPPYWLDHDDRLAVDFKRLDQRRAILLRYEERARQLTGQPLLGPERDDSFIDHCALQALFRVLCGPLPEEKFQRVLRAGMDMGIWIQELDPLPSAWEEGAKQDYVEYMITVGGQILSPEETRALTSRFVAVKACDRYEAAGFNPGELERLCTLITSRTPPAAVFAGLDDGIRGEQEAVFDAAALETFGPDRFAQWLADHDSEFGNLAGTLERRADRTEVLLRLRDLRSGTRELLEQARMDFGRSLLERTLEAQRIKLQAAAEVQALLGPDGARELQGKAPADWFYPGGVP
jgi:hypothetical protein